MRQKPRLVVGGQDGVVRRRAQWPDGEKARVVAESHAAGAKVVDVARRHGIRRAELSRWRGLARDGRLPSVDGGVGDFAALIVDGEPAAVDAQAGLIEIVVGGVVVRMTPDAAPRRIAQIAAALLTVNPKSEGPSRIAYSLTEKTTEKVDPRSGEPRIAYD